MLRTKPCVFVVGENYQIMVPVRQECLMRAKVGEEYFYDESLAYVPVINHDNTQKLSST